MGTPEKRITYNNLDILTPYEIKHINELRIDRKINEHTVLFFSGIIPEEKKDSYIETASAEDTIEVVQLDEGSKVRNLFKGVVSNICVRCIKGIYYLEAEALSYTCIMDIKLIYRSFQNKQMTYDDLINKVIKGYSGADYKDYAANGSALNEFTVQYNETDWQFLKRMASRFGAVLVPQVDSDGPKFFFGIPGEKEGSLSEELDYTVRKDVSSYLYLSENNVEGLEDFDFAFYEVESSTYLDLGDKVKFLEKDMVVASSKAEMKSGTMKFIYILAFPNGIKQKRLLNSLITGAAIEGKVLETSSDTVKVHLEIDSEQNAGEANWFKYATNYTAEGNSGWYVMPQVGDFVKLYFPNENEDGAVVINSVRKSGESCPRTADPGIKYFETNYKKHMKSGGKDLIFTANEGKVFIKLDEENGIELESDKPVSLSSEKDFTIDVEKNMIVNAGESIFFSCNESSSITMDGMSAETHFQASMVKVEGYKKSAMSLGDVVSMVKDTVMMPVETVIGLGSMCSAVGKAAADGTLAQTGLAVVSSLPVVAGAKKVSGMEEGQGGEEVPIKRGKGKFGLRGVEV
ncbi:MAG: hypothetical protein GX660_12965 [Clostridiaceae bacterium]|nr:hypothetical protein [Clostridiaceae bacterium]